MNVNLTLNGQQFLANLDEPLNIAIPIRRDSNPNCYYTEPVQISPIRADGFVGSLLEGGSVNHMRLSIAPHGNGTHTECSGHIYNNDLTLNKVLNDYHFTAQVVSVLPGANGKQEFIDKEQIDNLSIEPGIQALVIRSLPNDMDKLGKNYSGANPPFISEQAMARITELNIEHLIVDLPSVDPEVDEGRLGAHKMFWSNEIREKKCTITEFAFIPNRVSDGLYLLNLQTLKIELDASPSNPVLYSLKAI